KKPTQDEIALVGLGRIGTCTVRPLTKTVAFVSAPGTMQPGIDAWADAGSTLANGAGVKTVIITDGRGSANGPWNNGDAATAYPAAAAAAAATSMTDTTRIPRP